MRNYEVTFIVDPTLSNDEIKSAAKKYADMIAKAGKIVYNNEGQSADKKQRKSVWDMSRE